MKINKPKMTLVNVPKREFNVPKVEIKKVGTIKENR